MYYYYKGHEKAGRWWPLDEVELAERVEKDQDIGFVSVLSVSEGAGPGKDISDSAEYSGPFYLDFDSDSLKKSIKAAKSAVAKLIGMGTPADLIQIWASGKKGFHITIPMWAFTDQKAVKRLPRIYLWIARSLQLKPSKAGGEWDDTVYSCGKGRMWRVVNRERRDNQQFKVPITIAELNDLDEESYTDLCKAPRELPQTLNGSGPLIPALVTKWQIAVACADKEKKPTSTFIDPVIREELDGKLPPCVDDLLRFDNIREGKGFNDISLQFAKGIAAFGESDEIESLIDEFSEKSKGKDSYTSPQKRRTHCVTAYKRASRSASYDWSCASILAVLGRKPCAGCKIKEHVYNVEAEGNSVVSSKSKPATVPKPIVPVAPTGGAVSIAGFVFEDQAAADIFNRAMLDPKSKESNSSRPLSKAAREAKADKELTEAVNALSAPPADPPADPPPPSDDDAEPPERPEDTGGPDGPDENYLEMTEGMGFLTKDGNFRRVSNFTFKILEKIVEYIPAIQAERLVSLTVETYVMGRKAGVTFLEEEAWLSKSRFLSSFLGLQGLAFYGKEDDIQRIRSALVTRMDDETTKIRRIYSHGIVHQRVGEQDIFSYVEPGWSIDNLGFENLYAISGKLDASPELKAVEETAVGDEIIEDILLTMTQINTEYTVSQLIGWFMACFLKQHVFSFRNEFPLLNVNGQAGAGKTQTACLLGALHGVDFLMTEKPMTISTSSEFPIWRYVESSMTVPRIFDEFNKSKMTRTYDKISEVLKEVFNQHTISRGTISGTKMHGPSRSGAHTIHIPLTGPVVLLSEQSIEAPALRERNIQVSLSKQQRKSEAMTKAFRYCVDARHNLKGFAKFAYMTALHIEPIQVRKWIDEYFARVPDVIDDRPRYNIAVILMGMRYMSYLAEKLMFFRLKARMNELIEKLIFKVETEMVGDFLSRQRSEVDIVIEKMGIMAAMTSTGTVPWLEKRRHYFKTPTHLLIDISVCHAMYVRYMRTMEMSPAVIESPHELKKLLKDEPYCISTEISIPEFAKGRAVAQLDVAEMRKKGLDPDQFEGAGV